MSENWREKFNEYDSCSEWNGSRIRTFILVPKAKYTPEEYDARIHHPASQSDSNVSSKEIFSGDVEKSVPSSQVNVEADQSECAIVELPSWIELDYKGAMEANKIEFLQLYLNHHLKKNNNSKTATAKAIGIQSPNLHRLIRQIKSDSE